MDNLEMTHMIRLDMTIRKTKDVRDVRDGTIRNGQSRDTDIDIHKKKTLETLEI